MHSLGYRAAIFVHAEVQNTVLIHFDRCQSEDAWCGGAFIVLEGQNKRQRVATAHGSLLSHWLSLTEPIDGKSEAVLEVARSVQWVPFVAWSPSYYESTGEP